MQEREISLLDLLVEILLRWRVLLICMLIGGSLMGGLSFVRSYRTAEAQKAQIAEMEKKLQEKKEQLESDQHEEDTKGNLATKEYLQEQLTEVQKNNINTVLDYESFIEELEAYCDSSILMQLDPLNISQARLTFLVTAHDEERSHSIERIYEDMISAGLFQWIADNSAEDISPAALGELIAISRSSRELVAGGDSFSVTVVHATEEQCRELAQAVVTYINQQQERVKKELGSHEIVVVNEAYSQMVDTTLLDKQRGVKKNISTWKSDVASKKAAFSDEEWKYYNFVTMGKAQGTPEEYEKEDSASDGQQTTQESTALDMPVVTPPSVSMKYVILGMILLAFVYVLYIFMAFIFNNRLRISDDMNQLYGIPQLGQIPEENTKKKVFSFVDSWILRIRDRSKRKFSEEEAIGLAAAAVKISAKREELSGIYCIGCNMQEKTAEVSARIQAVLAEENIGMQVLNNILYNQEAMEQLQGVKGAFLLEKAGETFYDEVAKELELLHRQNIKVLGIVVVE